MAVKNPEAFEMVKHYIKKVVPFLKSDLKSGKLKWVGLVVVDGVSYEVVQLISTIGVGVRFRNWFYVEWSESGNKLVDVMLVNSELRFKMSQHERWHYRLMKLEDGVLINHNSKYETIVSDGSQIGGRQVLLSGVVSRNGLMTTTLQVKDRVVCRGKVSKMVKSRNKKVGDVSSIIYRRRVVG